MEEVKSVGKWEFWIKRILSLNAILEGKSDGEICKNEFLAEGGIYADMGRILISM